MPGCPSIYHFKGNSSSKNEWTRKPLLLVSFQEPPKPFLSPSSFPTPKESECRDFNLSWERQSLWIVGEGTRKGCLHIARQEVAPSVRPVGCFGEVCGRTQGYTGMHFNWPLFCSLSITRLSICHFQAWSLETCAFHKKEAYLQVLI